MNDVPKIKAFTGDDTTYPVEITSDDGTGPVAVDLTGHVLSWIVSSTRDTGHLLQKDVSSHTDATAGLSSVTLTAADLTTIGGAGNFWFTGIDVNTTLTTEITRAIVQLEVIDRVQRV